MNMCTFYELCGGGSCFVSKIVPLLFMCVHKCKIREKISLHLLNASMLQAALLVEVL